MRRLNICSSFHAQVSGLGCARKEPVHAKRRPRWKSKSTNVYCEGAELKVEQKAVCQREGADATSFEYEGSSALFQTLSSLLYL